MSEDRAGWRRFSAFLHQGLWRLLPGGEQLPDKILSLEMFYIPFPMGLMSLLVSNEEK